MLDVRRRPIVIVGGGAVAARKAKLLVSVGATKIRCVSPAFHPDMPAEVERVTAEFAPERLDGAGLVFAATNSADVNDAVVREATMSGILVSRADVDEDNPGDFTMPAVHRDGPISLTVSAGSPALAAAIRDELVDGLDPGWARLAAAHAQLRPMLLASDVTPEVRRRMFHALSTRAAMQANAQGGLDGLVEWLRNEMPNLPWESIVLSLLPRR